MVVSAVGLSVFLAEGCLLDRSDGVELPPATRNPARAERAAVLSAYLAEVEVLVSRGRYDVAREILVKAKTLPVASPALDLRLAKLSDQVERGMTPAP
jgi:hypothetical protein